MRPIKFRAWDKRKKVMSATFSIFDIFTTQTIKDSCVSTVTHFPYGIEAKKNDDIVLMQYTGLLDKTGKPIYEGDIVGGVNGWTMTEGDRGYMTPYNMEVKWNDDELCWKLHDLGKNRFTWDLGRWRSEEVEVMGNIYECKHS